MVDIPGDSTTTATIGVGGTVSNSLEVMGDHDWFKISLDAGQAISVSLDGITLEDSFLRIYDANGNLLFENDDINPGVVRDSMLAFTANYTGTYYIDVGAWVPDPGDETPDYTGTGTYQLSVKPYTPPPLATVQQVSDQLVSGYWGGDSHHFDVTQGGTLTVNLTALTAAGQTLARAALASWTDIIGVKFSEVLTGGQITFDDNEEGAFTTGVWSNGIATSAHVNISTQWLADYGTGLNTYSCQSYIHEIGHALGLGHAGNYNGDARYPYDALFENDSWPLSIMSYFSQTDNSYFAGQGFNENFITTPMMADILAMSTLYGLSTTTRAGNTIYGPSWSGDMGALCIFDSGGIDTIDCSAAAVSQRIDLTSGSFSNVLGEVGNISIAIGVTIENAKGGSGDDFIIGNAAGNVLSGGGGDDTVTYETATAGVRVNLTTTAQQDTIGAGQDALSGFEHLIGSGFNDTLTGSSESLEIYGGDGNDRITSTGLGSHRLFGDNGDDWFVPGQGDDWLIGGDGFDTVDYSGATGPIYAATDGANNNTGTSGVDTIGSIEKIIGSNYNDTLFAYESGGELWGGAGNDTLRGSPSGASQLYGGVGNDTYEVRNEANQIIEVAGEGIDSVLVKGNYTLGSNIENLTLLQPVYDPYGGVSIYYDLPPDDFNGTGNDLANVITGNAGDNVLSGRLGADTLTGGASRDTFQDTASGLNGDTITDLGVADKIVISNASLASFAFSLSGSTLTYTGGSLTLTGFSGQLMASAAAGGGVQLTVVAPVNDEAEHDFNGDGRSDVLWRNNDGRVITWLSRADGSFASNSNGNVAVSNNWQVAGSGDFNGDGRDDVLWRNADGRVIDWLGKSDGGFGGNPNGNNMVSASWHITGVGDFNGDGRDDVLWRNDDGRVIDWVGKVDGGFGSNPNGNNTVSASWHVAGVGDFNGDGRDDILWRNDDGRVIDWLGKADGGFGSNPNGNNTVTNSWHVAGVGDFNGDGRDDILWRNDDGRVIDWLGKADGGFGSNPYGNNNVASSSHIDGVGDFNGDGRDDILWRSNSGLTTEWLGTASGGFADNGANASIWISTDWHVQRDYLLF